MRVFLSFSERDADLAAHLEEALRRNGIEARSSLNVASGEDWKRVLDEESANADAFIFLLGAGASVSPQLQAEWRALLRNDWESRKPLIPVIHGQGAIPLHLPPFLRNRRAVFTTNFDTIIGELRHLIEHPAEAVDHTHEQQARLEQERRLNELKDYALALKQESAGGEAKSR